VQLYRCVCRSRPCFRRLSTSSNPSSCATALVSSLLRHAFHTGIGHNGRKAGYTLQQ